jgi:hypothetical protein
MSEFYSICYLFAPLLLGLAFHGFTIRFGWLGFLVVPVDFGMEFRGKRLFGENKTFRGIVGVMIGTTLGFALQSLWLHNYSLIRPLELLDYSISTAIPLGFLVGTAAPLSELPNSFIKRQIGIAPGKTSNGWIKIVFYVLDQVDFLVGSWLAMSLAVKVSLIGIFYSFIFLIISHQIISILGYWLGMRKTAR